MKIFYISITDLLIDCFHDRWLGTGSQKYVNNCLPVLTVVVVVSAVEDVPENFVEYWLMGWNV